ncbi:glycosyltransferase [Paracoccus gahaiensis]|uniref:glycosyltransferase n=1 Tax=Paracoccus gahaiensis TaxID=1706839 RepID=UPI00145D1BAE|nr:glycosyltransferase [Paracoccus gahaiensis]
MELLFAPSRIESRLATFEHLTLALLQAQTDQNFIFLVVASEDMPDIYRHRLSEICASVPQVVLRFFPLTHVEDAQKTIFIDLSLDLKDVLNSAWMTTMLSA